MFIVWSVPKILVEKIISPVLFSTNLCSSGKIIFLWHKNCFSKFLWAARSLACERRRIFCDRENTSAFAGYPITFRYLIFFKVNLCVSVDTAQVAYLSKYRKLFLALWQAVKPLKITMICKKRKNNTLAHTYQWAIRVYAVYACVRMCIRVCAYMHTRIRVLGWRALRVYFGSDISELHCRNSMRNLHWCYTFCTGVTLELYCSQPIRIE